MRFNSALVCILVLTTGGVSCRWWGRLIPPFLKRNRESSSATKLSDISGAGLRNLGNTCYMNSVLQSLFYSIPYRERVLSSTFADESVGERVSWLFEEMEGAGNIDTSLVANALSLNIGTQEDAQEFLLRLLDEIDCSTDSDNETDGVEPISNSFRGATEQTIKCTNINFSKTRQQRFLDLTVDIMGHDNLGKALQEMFTKPDYLKGENQYRIPKGTETNGTVDEMQDAEKRIRVTELPDMLCFTLKRFSFDVATSSMTKIGDLLEFPLELDMKRFLSKEKSAPVAPAENAVPAVKVVDDAKKSPSSSYLLSSVVVHEGSAGFGHYVCYARPDPKKHPNGWLKLNDNAVSDVSAKDVFQTSFGTKNPDKYSKNAYMLFYTRK